jgi:GTP-binding protein
MIIHQAEFMTSVMHLTQLPEETLPEVALAGRSNVGKSSLINCMLSRKAIAKISATPGKTQMLNYYTINSSLYFVDCPGYGYAKVSKTQRSHWGNVIETYLRKREALMLVLQLIDVRHSPTKDDIAMFDWLRHQNLPICIVATKADKIPRSKWDRHIKRIKEELGMPKTMPIVLFSSETGKGREELWEIINTTIQEQPYGTISEN